MASFGKRRVFGRVIVLLIMILAIAIGGLFWFDFLGIVDAKSVFAPALRLVDFPTRTGAALPADSPNLLDDERFAKQLAAVDAVRQELSEREKVATEKAGRDRGDGPGNRRSCQELSMNERIRSNK